MEESKSILDLIKYKEELLRKKIQNINNLIENDQQITEKKALKSLAEILFKRFSVDFIDGLDDERIYGFIKKRYEFVENVGEKELAVLITPFLTNGVNGNRSKVVIEFTLKDRPFTIDSVTEYFHGKDFKLDLILYPVIDVSFSGEGKIVSISRADKETECRRNYSCFIVKNFDIAEIETVKKDITSLLEMVCCVTDDFYAMSKIIEDYSKKREENDRETLMESERRQLYTWFNEGNVILIGSGEVDKSDVSSSLTWDKIEQPLGRVRRLKKMNCEVLPREIGRLGKYFLGSGLEINLIETPVRSEIHRSDRLQILFGKKKDENGNVKVNFFQILFTNKSLKQEAMAIPLARLKVNSILDSQLENTGGKNGHLLKMAHDFFSIIPKSELFRLDRTELDALFRQFRYFGDYQTTRINVYTQPLRRYARIAFCLPHRRFSPNIFDEIEEILCDRLGLRSELKYWFTLGRNVYSHHIFWFPKNHPQLERVDLSKIEKDVASLTMGWEEEFQTCLSELDKAGLYREMFSNKFGQFYQAVFSPQDAIRDLSFLEAVLNTGKDQVDLRDVSGTEEESMISIFSKERYNLTKIMPHFQNMGITVIDENTYGLSVGSEKVYIYTYYINHLKKQQAEFANFHRDFCDLMLAVLEERTENDILNSLLILSGLNRSEINLFILYRNYYWQIGAPYLPINKSFQENPTAVIALRDYFITKFDPTRGGEPLDSDQLSRMRDEVFKVIYDVKTVAEDIIFKTIFNLMESTIRTNYFDIDEASTLAIKVESKLVEHMPLPRPKYEIYVHGTHVEGIHLRGSKIARGGIRHSDRHDDFRTEILGLMNTQMLKNVVIVPEGSKGGFITKRLLTDRAERAAEGIKQYKIYINSLLSITDNIVDGKVVPARDIVRYDEDDPYFVVAADKGTATFSDTANEIAQSRNFWLGDAFASGGRFGYDHKGMGITARGGWESVKYHFLEDGIDIQTNDFTVVGIGDMSGDVFGNGMLLSKHIRLIAAFNHIHIFVDPDPDSASSWEERNRLFNTPGSSWTDYDTRLISQGGGVFERAAKSIELSPEIKGSLGISSDIVSGEELIRLILQAKVDLLWNGGIGTYVKASSETAHQVGDAANDSVRIDASRLKVKTIGEGGNLGLTQMARMEAAAMGIHLNTDAIDNSGGVDTSDHEVNLKILMSSLIEKGQIASQDERNTLLEELTEDIAKLVLEDNKGQAQIISMDNIRSQKDMKSFLDLIKILAERDVMDPRNEKFSTTEELDEYYSSGVGILRPDLALLLSFSKMFFSKELLKSSVLEDPYLERVYYSYFPESFKNKYDITEIQHPLKKEIVGTVLVNKTINQAGVTLLPEILSTINVNPVNIIVAYTVIDQVFQLGSLRKKVMSELETKDLKQAYALKIKIEQFIQEIMFWMLFSFNSDTLTFSMIEEFIGPVDNYKKVLNSSMGVDEKQQLSNISENLSAIGISEALANELAILDFMKDSMEIIVQSKKSNISIENTIILFQGMDSMLHFQTLNRRIMELKMDSPWVKKHKGLLMQQLQRLKIDCADTIISRYNEEQDFEEKMILFMRKNKRAFKEYQIDYKTVMGADSIELSAIAILLSNISKVFS